MYRGLAPTMIGLIPYSAAYYAFYDCLNVTYRRSAAKLTLAPWETLLLGALAGSVLQLSCNSVILVLSGDHHLILVVLRGQGLAPVSQLFHWKSPGRG